MGVLLNPLALGEHGLGKGGKAGDSATVAVDHARGGVPLLRLCISLTSTVAFAQPPPLPLFTEQGFLNYSPGKKVSFLQQTALSESSF